MKTKLMAFVSKTLARAVGAMGRDMAKNGLGQYADNAAPDEKVPRDPPSRAALFADSGLCRPVWGFLRVEDVIR